MRAPTIKNLLSVSGLAKKGHQCILNEYNPRLICKDGTVVPIYFMQDLFFLPFLVPTNSIGNDHGEFPPAVDEAEMLSSAFGVEEDNDKGSEEAVVRLSSSVLPNNQRPNYRK